MKVTVSQDGATGLQPGQQCKTLSQEKKEKEKKTGNCLSYKLLIWNVEVYKLCKYLLINNKFLKDVS